MAASACSVTFHNGYKMPIVGLGTFTASSEEVGAAVETALEAGYRHIDTATLYNNEAAIGEVLKKWLDSGKVKREELFIVTKLPPFDNIVEESVEQYLKLSLEALQLSYVDLYLIHNPLGIIPAGTKLSLADSKEFIDHVKLWKAMEAQVDAGRARSIGLSNFNARQIKRIVKAARIPPANLQIELHVYLQQRELAAFCNALDITVCAYSPLGSPGLPEYLEKMNTEITGLKILSPLEDPVVLDVAKKHGKTPAQILLRHIIQRGIVTIPKSIKPDRIRQNFQVFDFQLDEDDVNKLNALDKGAKARVFGANVFSRFTSHPEYPYSDPY